MGISRADRVGELVREEISSLLVFKLEDPRLQNVTVTKVKMTKDLRIARVYYARSGGDEAVKATGEAFEKARPLFKKSIGKNLSLRYMPELEFYYDQNLDHADRIEEALRKIKEDGGLPDEEGD